MVHYDQDIPNPYVRHISISNDHIRDLNLVVLTVLWGYFSIFWLPKVLTFAKYQGGWVVIKYSLFDGVRSKEGGWSSFYFALTVQLAP